MNAAVNLSHSKPQKVRPAFVKRIKAIAASIHPDPQIREFARLRKLPRYQSSSVTFLGKQITVVDAATFLGGYREIFQQGIYNFRAKSEAPRIIDCGANIGLSVIYFKQLYAKSRVLAFEADSKIFSALKYNLDQFGFADVQIEQKAVWVHNTGVNFHPEGGYSGRITLPGDEGPATPTESVRLRDYLNEPVDFLKIDIEGAETEVMRDCQDQLVGVDHLFVEYHSHIRQEQTLDELLSIFKNAGFRYHITDAYTREQPFIDHRDMLGMDLQLNIFGYRD
jgi:FkbM family methyltransferase